MIRGPLSRYRSRQAPGVTLTLVPLARFMPPDGLSRARAIERFDRRRRRVVLAVEAALVIGALWLVGPRVGRGLAALPFVGPLGAALLLVLFSWVCAFAIKLSIFIAVSWDDFRDLAHSSLRASAPAMWFRAGNSFAGKRGACRRGTGTPFGGQHDAITGLPQCAAKACADCAGGSSPPGPLVSLCHGNRQTLLEGGASPGPRRASLADGLVRSLERAPNVRCPPGRVRRGDMDLVVDFQRRGAAE